MGRLFVTSGVGGHLAEPECDGAHDLLPTSFAHYAPWLVAASHDRDHPLVVDTGGLLAPGGVAMFAAREDPTALAALVQQLGYRALAFGIDDLSAPRAPMIAVMAELRARGIPMLADNLWCDPSAHRLCDVLVDGSDGTPMFEVGEERTALLAVVAADALHRVAPDRARGLQVQAPKDYLPGAMRRARTRGATLVVVSFDGGGAPSAAARALTLVAALPPDAKPDILLIADAGQELLFARPVGFRPAMVSAPPGAGARLQIRRNMQTHGFDVMARPLPEVDAPPAAVQGFIENMGPRYCGAWGSVLPGGRLHGPIDGPGMLALSAGAMRHAADAEIAILNHGALDPAWHPARPGALTASDVHVALPYDDPLVVARVPASWLKKVAKSASAADLLALGLTSDGTTIKVNGRPLLDDGRYRVVTIRFLASGGDGALPAGPRWEPVHDASLRSAVLHYLGRTRRRDPREAFSGPDREPEWVFRSDANLTFAGSATDNPASATGEGQAYTATQLTSADTLSFGFQLDLHLSATAPFWGWDNEMLASYRTTRTGTNPYAEGDDQLFYRTTLRWRGIRQSLNRPWVPDPYFEGYLESEITRPPERSYHHLLLRPTVGFGFPLTGKLTLKLAAGVERELLESHGPGPTRARRAAHPRRVDGARGGGPPAHPRLLLRLLREHPVGLVPDAALERHHEGHPGGAPHLRLHRGPLRAARQRATARCGNRRHRPHRCRLDGAGGAVSDGVTVHLVDGTYELFRAYFAVPSMQAPDGREVGAARGMLRSLAAWLRQGAVDHVGCAFNHVIESFRNGLFGGYKTGEGVDPALLSQFSLAEQVTRALGIVTWPMVQLEADDALASAAAQLERDPRVARVVIVSPDKDLCQCVRGERIVTWDRFRDRVWDEAGVRERLGVAPASVPDYLGLVGDSADGIPGLAGWGPKSAATVLGRYGHIDAIPDDAAGWDVKVRGAARLGETLRAHREQAALYRRLATLESDAPIDASVEALAWGGPDRPALEALCADIGERSVLDRI